jgi:uncharacterized protein YraI
MPKIADMIRSYEGPEGMYGWCRTRLYRLDSQLMVVVVSDRPETPEGRVAVVAAELATAIRAQHLEPGEGLAWIEHQPGPPEHFDRVLLRWDGERYGAPERRPSSRQEVERLIGEALE